MFRCKYNYPHICAGLFSGKIYPFQSLWNGFQILWRAHQLLKAGKQVLVPQFHSNSLGVFAASVRYTKIWYPLLQWDKGTSNSSARIPLHLFIYLSLSPSVYIDFALRETLWVCPDRLLAHNGNHISGFKQLMSMPSTPRPNFWRILAHPMIQRSHPPWLQQVCRHIIHKRHVIHTTSMWVKHTLYK